MKFDKVPVIEALDLPREWRVHLEELYVKDNINISNDSYTRYPNNWELPEIFSEGVQSEFDKWLVENLAETPEYIIIYWSW